MRLLCAHFRCWLKLGIAVCAPVAVAMAHPNHDAIAEADWNAETGSLEVALQINAHQLERAVSLAAGEALDLDEEESAAPLKAYVAEHVRFLKPDGVGVEMQWVGAEIKVRSAWLYFEFPMGKDSGVELAECSLSNTLLFEQFEDQKNTIAMRLHPDEQRRFLRFSKAVPVVKVQSPPGKEDTIEVTGEVKDSTKP